MTEAKQKKSINEKINVQLMSINVQGKREAQITELMTCLLFRSCRRREDASPPVLGEIF